MVYELWYNLDYCFRDAKLKEKDPKFVSQKIAEAEKWLGITYRGNYKGY